MKKRLALLLLLPWILATCKDKTIGISSTAHDYLGRIIATMQADSINRNTIDWENFSTQVYLRAGNAQSIADTYEAIRYAVIAPGDHHSFYVSADHTVTLAGSPPNGCGGEAPDALNPPDSIGYLRIDGYSDQTQAMNDAFAQTLQNQIKAQDRDYLKGWIVDLRFNTGGDCWPMLAGAGPVLGEGVVGYFSDIYNNLTPWSYTSGSSRDNNAIVDQVTNPYTLIRSNPRVAVLIGSITASSGEVMVIAFEGRSDTSFLGQRLPVACQPTIVVSRCLTVQCFISQRASMPIATE